jgi:hypothetical protein
LSSVVISFASSASIKRALSRASIRPSAGGSGDGVSTTLPSPSADTAVWPRAFIEAKNSVGETVLLGVFSIGFFVSNVGTPPIFFCSLYMSDLSSAT